jgi:hypothetical protein
MATTQKSAKKIGSNNSNTPATMRALQVLLVVNAAVWLIFGTVAFFGGTTNPDQVLVMKFLSFFMFGDAGLFVAVFIGTIKYRPWVYTGGLILSIVNIILSVTDEFGAADFIVIFLSLAVLILLLVNKKTLTAYKNNR